MPAFSDDQFEIKDGADNTKRAKFSLGGASAGADLTLAWSGTADGTVTIPNATTTLAGLAVGQTFTKPQVIDNDTASDVLLKLVPHASQSADILQVRNSGDTDSHFSLSAGGDFNFGSATRAANPIVHTDTSGGAVGLITARDASTGFDLTLGMSAHTAARTLLLPDVDGNLLTSTGVALTTFQLRSNTPSAGASFRDQTTNSKMLRFVLSGAVGNNAFTIANTAARTYTFGNLSGNVVVVGDDPPAVASGGLGKVDSTAQVANITTTALSSTPPAGLYVVEVYLACTTADVTAGTLAVTIAWTDVVGATTDATTIAAFSLAATGRTRAIYGPLQVSSGDISYAVAITGAYGTSAYAIYARTISLG